MWYNFFVSKRRTTIWFVYFKVNRLNWYQKYQTRKTLNLLINSDAKKYVDFFLNFFWMFRFCINIIFSCIILRLLLIWCKWYLQFRLNKYNFGKRSCARGYWSELWWEMDFRISGNDHLSEKTGALICVRQTAFLYHRDQSNGDIQSDFSSSEYQRN